jgi:hypothetical protein
LLDAFGADFAPLLFPPKAFSQPSAYSKVEPTRVMVTATVLVFQ